MSEEKVVHGGKRFKPIEAIVFIVILVGAGWWLSSIMGVGPMFSTIMKTAYSLLLETVFYITAICVLSGALGALLAEFSVVEGLQKIISPIMRPIYGLPGAASLGVVTTFLSDNPAVVALAKDKNIIKYFKKYQVAALCNMGTAYGMGLIVCTFMIGLGSQYVTPTVIGFFGAVIGSIVSTRLMLYLCRRFYKKQGVLEEKEQYETGDHIVEEAAATVENEHKSIGARFLNAMLDGGMTGVQIGAAITPGVLCICTLIMILTFGPGTVNGVPTYTGAAYEGIKVLPKLGEMIFPVTNILFGFQDGSNITFPITSLGAVGAALGLVPKMLKNGLCGGNEIAVFTAMGMCWSGYLSTHVSMMDALRRRELTGFAIGSHTVGGIAAGIAAHYMFLIFG